MWRSIKLLIAFLLLCLNIETRAAISLSRYRDFARASADWTWTHFDSLEDAWRERIDPASIWGYRPPSRLLEMASIYATLYDMERRDEDARRARVVLKKWDDYTKAYPKSAARRRTDYNAGVPPLPDFFTTMRYIRPYEILKRHGLLSQAEQKEMEDVIARGLRYTLRTQEWGPMNRTVLRAEALAWAVRAASEHPESKIWRFYERALAFDNWGNWEIEDAAIYHAVWVYGLLGYADATSRMKELFNTPEMFYYAQYFLYMISPEGTLPDFGDARWKDNWARYLVFFEAAAAAYQNPEMKWAANQLAEIFIDFTKIQNTGLAFLLLDAARFGSDNVPVQKPTAGSMEVMEDIVGKKIVFRDGWEPTSIYMMLNYRDEGDGGLLFRDYLRDTIPVEEEKMTHGHADENSIILLMDNGSILLRDGGYRDYMPSGPYGNYRQDYFHNRLCVRQEKIWMGQKQGEYRYSHSDRRAVPGQSVLDFLHNAGSYRPIRTYKIDFLTFEEFDYSRTRLVDDPLGYTWDRVIVHVKDPACFVVFDILKATEEEFFTAANLWHTRKIVDQGSHWYDTVYDSLKGQSLNTDTRLLIHFPKNHYRMEQVESIRRNTQKEWVISETTAQHFELGQHIGFVTVLTPHSSGVSPKKILERVEYIEPEPEGAGLHIVLKDKDKTVQIGVKRDLRMDMIRDWRRPKYTYEAGKIRYDDLETNGDFIFAERKNNTLQYTIVNLTKATIGDRVLYEQLPSSYGLAFDGSPDAPGVGKVRYWRDEVVLK